VVGITDGYVAVAALDELAPGQMKRLNFGGQRILLANAAGRYYAVDELCSHEDYSLAFGCVKGTAIKCSLHGSHFSLETGAALDPPATEPLRTYPVRIADGQVWVNPAG